MCLKKAARTALMFGIHVCQEKKKALVENALLCRPEGRGPCACHHPHLGWTFSRSRAPKKQAPALAPPLAELVPRPSCSSEKLFFWMVLSLLCFVLVLVSPGRGMYVKYRERMKGAQNQ